MTFRILLSVILALGCGITLGEVGKERKPTTSGTAFVSLVLTGLVIYGIWNWM